jgi:hypothetical protein
MYALLASISRKQLVTSRVQNRLLACVRFLKLIQFQIHPPLNILTVPDWLNVKFHYFLRGPKVKISNTLMPLTLIYVMLFHCCHLCELLHMSNRFVLMCVTNLVSFLARFKVPKSCQILQYQLFQKVPQAINFDTNKPASSLYPP